MSPSLFLLKMKTDVGLLGLFLAIALQLCGNALSKECTNIPSQLSSHTLRFELQSSKNESWKREMFSLYHLIPTDENAWLNLLPRKLLNEREELEWTVMYREMKRSGGFLSNGGAGGNFLEEVSLHNVRLDRESLHYRAQQTNLEYLLMLDVDSLVWSFRKTAALPTAGEPYGGWEGPDVELRGHFVGHYLSATAKMWASTHNDTLKEKMSAVLRALSACQDKLGSGYLSAFPSELFDRFEAIKPVWAPYYTIHKIMAGLLDQYTFTGNDQALKMLTWMVDYFYRRVQNVISQYTIERHWQSLNEEIGGMNDVLYRLYTVTNDPKHLMLAHLFDKPCFLGLLAVQADDISGFHANTHIPVVIGAQMRYEVTGDPIYKTIGAFFMDIVNSSHSYATGGTSVSEFWSDPKRLATTLQTENEESCTTYNMLKVSRHLFRWTKEVAYADYYERALTNGVLGIQRGTEPGVMIYMLPLGQGVSKAVSYHGWGTKFNSFWCCYGTGIESFSKLGDSIYFEEKGQTPGLYVTQYISSSLDWQLGLMVVSQKVEPVTSSDPYLRVKFTISAKQVEGQSATLNFRIPSWSISAGAKAELNRQSLTIPAPGNFLSITKKWSWSDELTLQLPISLRTEAIKDDRSEYSSINAILYGPYLLAGLTNGDWKLKSASISDWISAVPEAWNSQLLSLSQQIGNSTFVVSNSNQSITMEKLPQPGTLSSVHSTFKIIQMDPTLSTSKISSPEDFMGKSIALEPFDVPGSVIMPPGDGKNFAIQRSGDANVSTFRLVSGLDGNSDTVSLESVSQKGCYISSSGTEYSGGESLKLSCISDTSGSELRRAASFTLRDGIARYHPISFVVKGVDRDFLLAPLNSLRDEVYTVYFDIHD
ncbi:hypothetical protein SAY87_001798 [Trapa incisa]|uniref:Uncharacterized protein n=1 Tax=Trapa incisa TaxID=236973 RepID=A0AAN7PTT0_9MYRT|nr:hypothetical protein SAY87_001798 [Trapa incisa]